MFKSNYLLIILNSNNMGKRKSPQHQGIVTTIYVPKKIGTNQKIVNSGQNYKYIRSKK